MSFLNPSFLWALIAISIPIIIHLINFRRYKTLYFSNTRFLENLQKETKNKRNLKQILILLSRILMITMLVFAFAGPYIPNKTEEDSNPVKITGVYLDNSFSMQAESKSGELFSNAKQIAIEIANNNSTDMKYLLFSNDLKPEHNTLMTKDKFVEEISQTDISSFQISLEDLVLKANSLIPGDAKTNLYLISDMQNNFLDGAKTDINSNIDMIFFPLEGVIANNIFIDTCYFETPVHKLGQNEKLIVRVKSASDEDNFDIPLKLYLNDSLKAFAGVNIASNETKTISLEYVNTVSGSMSSKIEISDYPVVYDNNLFFNYHVSEGTNVLIINGMGESKFLNAAFLSDLDNFSLTNIKQGNESNLSFSSFDFIVLQGISEISTGLTANIKSFVEEGGSVAFIPGEQISHGSINNFLSVFNAGVYNYSIDTSNSKIDFLDYQNILFRNVFQRIDNQVDLPEIKLLHDYKENNKNSASVIIRTQNNAPVLTSYEYFNGNIFVFTVPFNNKNDSFLTHPLFIPIVYNLAINSQLNNPLYTILKHNSEYEIVSFGNLNNDDLIKIKDESEIEIIPQSRFIGNSLKVFIPEEIDQDGNYKIYSGDNFITGLSLNYDRQESNTMYYEKEKLEIFVYELFGDNAIIFSESKNGFTNAISELSLGNMLWKYFVLASLLFIIIEILLIRFLR